MTARVLVVDDVEANVKLLEARLRAEYFEVLTATNGPDAIKICEQRLADIILLDVMMPNMDGFEVCRRLKACPETEHLPVVMVTALDQVSDKVQGLEAGADDFLTKPVDEIALITRVRNLARVKLLNDEMLLRAATGEQFGLVSCDQASLSLSGDGGHVLLVDDQVWSADKICAELRQVHTIDVVPDPQEAFERARDDIFDLMLVSLSLQDSDGLRLCSQLRSLEQTRHLPIIILLELGDEARLIRGLDIGVNDYLVRPIDSHEMHARVRTQIKRKRYSDHLRNRLEERVVQAVIDPLTGLHNRRYLEGHMRGRVTDALETGKPFSMLIIDVDYFKSVNDRFGHDVGDDVLKELAMRLQRNTRGIDLACRLGGEEFVIIMPETDSEMAYRAGERLRRCIADVPFTYGENDEKLLITASFGLASLEHNDDTATSIFKRADQALYHAKRTGRNRVMVDAA